MSTKPISSSLGPRIPVHPADKLDLGVISIPQPGRPKFEYPSPPTTGGVTEIRHGVEIKDPWRALEDLDSDVTKKFIREQNALSKPFLHSHPVRDHLTSLVHSAYSYERTSSPIYQPDGWYYWLYNPGTWQRDVFVRSRSLEDFGKAPPFPPFETNGAVANGDVVKKAGPEIVFDPNQESNTSIYAYSWSADGSLFNVILQDSGSDWQRIRTISTTTKLPVEPDLSEGKFTFGATFVDNHGFLYKRPVPTANSQTSSSSSMGGSDSQFGYYYHHIGTPQSSDTLIWRAPLGPHQSTTIPGRPVMMSVDERDTQQRRWMCWDIYRNTNPETEVYVAEVLHMDGWSQAQIGQELCRMQANGKWLARGYTGETHYVGTLSNGTHLFFTTTSDPAGSILALPSDNLDSIAAGGDLAPSVLVPPHPAGLLLEKARLVGDKLLVLVYLRDACAEVVFADARTGLPLALSDAHGTVGSAHTGPNSDIPVPPEEVETALGDHATMIPKHASITSISARQDSPEFYLTVETFLAPPYVLAGRLQPDGQIQITRLGEASADLDFICSQVKYPSYDGTLVPLFLCHRRDLDLTRPQKTLVYAYGGSGYIMKPNWTPIFGSLMRLNAIVAVACIRGGGEYGKGWHDCAVGINRFKSYEDFSHAAKYLQGDLRLTTPELTASYGISNGGLLVANCANRDPEIWGGVMCDVGVLDMTRYHLFTLGRMWTAEYGSPDDPEQLQYIHAMSPYHNIKDDVTYPAVFVTTGDHDTRVVPGVHSLKYLAELQQKRESQCIVSLSAPLSSHSGHMIPLLISLPTLGVGAAADISLGRIYENAGHEAESKSTEQKVEEAVDRLVFLLYALRESA